MNKNNVFTGFALIIAGYGIWCAGNGRIAWAAAAYSVALILGAIVMVSQKVDELHRKYDQANETSKAIADALLKHSNRMGNLTITLKGSSGAAPSASPQESDLQAQLAKALSEEDYIKAAEIKRKIEQKP